MRGHVLSKFRKEEADSVAEAQERAADAIECSLREGFETAMNRFNLSDKSEKPEKPVASGENLS